jgi:hypothetical protein
MTDYRYLQILKVYYSSYDYNKSVEWLKYMEISTYKKNDD